MEARYRSREGYYLLPRKDRKADLLTRGKGGSLRDRSLSF
jgi:hypothetical protein